MAGRATSLVGRDREVASLQEAIATAAAGHGRVVLIEGEPGIGKTRLVATACAHARDLGFEVLEGSSNDLGPARPFAPFLDALGIGRDSDDPDRALVAELVDTHNALDANLRPGAPNPGLQFRVVEALAALVERLAARSPLVMALDDLQWADPSTMVAIRSIARRIETLPVVFLGSCRAGHEFVALHRVTDDLLRAGATRIPLGPLDDDAVASLIAEVLDSTPSADLLTRAQGASGNPLFVIEYVRSLQGSPTIDSSPDTTPEFRATVLRRLATLPGATTETLRLAAVLGSTFSPADLAVATKQSAVELAPALHQAAVANMLEDRGGQLAFRHALVRDAIYEQIPAAVRRQLHRDLGRALAAGGSNSLAVAHHLSLGAAPEDAEAVEWLRRAARDAAPSSPPVAVELLRRARDLTGPTSTERDALLAELALVLAWAGELAEAAALSVEVLSRHPGSEVSGALRCGLVYALTWQGRPIEALKHAQPEPDERLSDMDAVLLQAEAAVASLFAFDLKTAGVMAAEAGAAAARLGHELAHCHALTVQSWVSLFAGRTQDATELAQQAVDIADRSAGGEPHLAHPRFFPGMPLLYVDRLDEADQMLRSGLHVAERLGLAWSLPLYHSFLGARGFIGGDWDGAVAECEAALAAADEVGLHIGVIASTASWLATIQVHRDDLEAAERTLALASGRLAETGPQLGMGVFNGSKALVLEARHQYQEALALLQFGWDLYMAGGPVTDPWSAMTFVRICMKAGEVERARGLLPKIEEQATATPTPFMRGQALRCRGLVEQDASLLVEAVELYRRSPRPFELAGACEDAAVLLTSTKTVEGALPLWDEAVALYEQLGAERDLARVAAQLRQNGIKRGARRRRVRASSGWESLTETEHKVVALVAQRLSNPEVAERLFISRHTVESHLKHIYRKLGLSSRLELAALAAQHSVDAAP